MTTATTKPKQKPEPTPNRLPQIETVQKAFDNIAQIPQDVSNEAGVIGSMILDPATHAGVVTLLPSVEAFYKPEHRVMYGVLLDMIQSNTAVDGMTFYTELKNRGLLPDSGGIEYITTVVNSVPTSAHAEYYAGYVREKWQKRRGISILLKSLRGLYEDPAGDKPKTAQACIDSAVSSLMELGETGHLRVARPLNVIVREVQEELRSSAPPTGIETGFLELDAMTGGLHRGEMIVIGARPSMGKTSLLVNMIEGIGLYSDRNILMFSMEQRDRELIMRMLSSHAAVNSHAVRRRQLSENEWEKMRAAVDAISVKNIFIDDTPGLSLASLFTKARRVHARHPLSMIGIDYLQLMECEGEKDRQQQITKISRGIKQLARELNVPVVCLSQLSRASATEMRLPRMNDLRESGSIEQDADVVMLLHRESVLHRGDEAWERENQEKLNEAIVIVAKQRNGPCDTIKLTFHQAQTRFVNYRPPGI